MSEIPDLEPMRRDNLSAFRTAPSVGSKSSPWTLVMGLGSAVGLGFLVFSALAANRQQAAQIDPIAQASTEVSQDYAHVGSSEYDSMAAFEQPYTYQESEAVSEFPVSEGSSPDPLSADARLHAPALIIDLSREEGPNGGANAQALANAVGGNALTGNERFSARFGAGQAAQARPLANPSATIPQGVIISAVLETAINSDLPGYVRALVSRDVSAFSGGVVLVPRGSRLIGQYRASPELGQSRAFVIWTRLIRPDGVSIELNSPGADALGRGGLDGETDRHFFRRFGGAILLTLLGGAASAVGDSDGTQIVVGVASSGRDAASAALSEEINIPPTISVAQGTPVRIFVARDLDFSGVSNRSP
ncbi:MAG: TrbI/VirB10 family protein [Hyphomonadaceae bacterium]